MGYYSWTGDADFAIVIRTATLRRGVGDRDEDEVTIRAGAGLVADSDPTAEYEETERKMEGVLAAIDRIRTDGELSEAVDDEPVGEEVEQ